MRFIIVGVFLLFSTPAVWAQSSKINWISLEEAYAKVQTAPKKVLVDVYTDWCGWCRVMDQKTFSDAAVVNYVNENYYAVKFNAESKKEVKLGGTTYKFNASNRVHEAAVALLQGKMSYPSIVYLDSAGSGIHGSQAVSSGYYLHRWKPPSERKFRNLQDGDVFQQICKKISGVTRLFLIKYFFHCFHRAVYIG
jgi:thioredoxin-related protein